MIWRRVAPRAGVGLLASTGLALALFAGACQRPGGKGKQGPPEVETLPVRVESLASRPFQRAARGVATLEPWRQVSLRAEAPGRILGIRHEVGDRVPEGALLVRLDGSVAWSSFQTAKVGIQQARVAVAHAKLNLERMRRLRGTGDIPQAQLDQAQNGYDAAQAALRMAEAQVAQVGTQLKNYWVRAPFAGVLAQRPVSVGDYLSPGTPVFTLAEVRRLKVVVGLDPAEGLHVRKGQAATVQVKTVKGPVSRPAKVHLVRPLADAVTRRIEVELEVANADGLLRPGVMAEVRLPLGTPVSKLLLPADAVVELLGRRYVYVVRKGKVERLPVALGVSAGHRVEIRPLGTQPVRVGEPIVVEGVPRLHPGAPVKIVPPAADGPASASRKRAAAPDAAAAPR